MEIQDIAKSCSVMAHTLGLRKKDYVMFISILMFALLGEESDRREQTVVEPNEPPDVPTPSVQTPTKRTKKQPPKDVNRPTEQKMLCKEGQQCICSECKKVVYRVSADLFDGLNAEQFASHFTPVGHAKPFPAQFRVRAIDGCVMTDCPVCEGDMSLVLWGRKPENDFNDTGVGSVGEV
jgi:hypothetical protein